jgi:LmbE family N-acetylglucosaminyl deacetylase
VLNFFPLLPQRVKEPLRLFASRSCQWVLRFTSQPYVARLGPTIVFAPHQDDETLGCGALIARKRNGGQAVHVVFLTDGSASHTNHPRVAKPEIAAMRLQEARHALAILGVDSEMIHFFNEPDGALDHLPVERREALVARITILLRQLQPTELFLPCSAGGSSEHDAAFGFVLEAIGCARLSATIWEYPVWLWWNIPALVRRMARPGRCRRAPTDDFLPAKRHALACYRSQRESLPPQLEPALPGSLSRLLDIESEYFFRLGPASPRPPAPAGSPA